MTWTGRVQCTMQGTYASARDQGTLNYPMTLAYSKALANGVIADACDLMFDDTRNLGISATENLDLAGVLIDAINQTLSFVKVVAIGLTAPTTNTVDLVFGNHATAAFVGPFGAATHTLALSPGGGLFLCKPNLAGWAVTATSADMIKVTNGAASSDYSIAIFGRSA